MTLIVPELDLTALPRTDPDTGEGYYHGALKTPGCRRPVWQCDHRHPKAPGARACARGERLQRAIPDPAPPTAKEIA
jgi:hypothetical protein